MTDAAEPIAWAEVAELPSITVEESDLDILELVQLLAGSRVGLTRAGAERTGEHRRVVLRDVESTPLAILTLAGESAEVRTLRALGAATATEADIAVLVHGMPSKAELGELEVMIGDRGRVHWLVLAGRGRGGRERVAQVAALLPTLSGGSHRISRIPWPSRAGGEFLLLERLPTDAALAALVGADRHFAVGQRGQGAVAADRGGSVLFFTGLSGSGKSTVAQAVRDALELRSSRPVTLLDGDDMRRMLTADLGFDEASRNTNVRRVSWVAALLAGNGAIAITALIAPFAKVREEAREMAEKAHADFVEVWVSTPLAECERRDRKGLYALARAGKIPDFTGIDSPYEAPASPDLVIDTSQTSLADAVEQVLAELAARAAQRGAGALLDRPDDLATGGQIHGI